MPEQERDQEQPLGPTEELLAREQAEAITRSQQPAPESLNAETPVHNNSTLAPAPQTEAEQAEERERHEREAQRDGQGQEQAPGWLQAPQNEGITSHPTPDTSPASPGKEQHQQALAEEAGERGGMKRTISTKTTLGAVITLDGAYVVPRYQTVIKETPMQDKVSYMRQLAKEQGNGRQQGQQPEQEKGRDRDRDRER